MATGVLGIAGGGSAALNQDVIDKLKAAESKATIDPIQTKLDNWDTESAKMLEINAANLELIDSFKAFSLDNVTNAFEQKTATTSGTAVTYDASDVSALVEGTTNVTVTQLAQKDIYQTTTFSDPTALISGGQDSGDTLSIAVGGTTYDFSTENQTYTGIAALINANANLSASVEQVGDSSYRLVIKSANSGTDNALTITQNGIDFGFGNGVTKTMTDLASDPSTNAANITALVINGDTIGNFPNGAYTSYADLAAEINNYQEGGVQQYQATTSWDAINHTYTFNISALDGSSVSVSEVGTGDGYSFVDESHVMSAQNLKATIDGISYDVSSNSITTQGSLKITANELGTSSITITKDTGSIYTNAQTMVDKYNAFLTLVDSELNSTDSTVSDKSTLRLMKSNIKDMLFANYGASSDLNIFNFGFDVDKSGFLSINQNTFNNAVSNNYDDLSALLTGTAENKGLGTLLATYTDSLDGYDGLLTQYSTNMSTKKTKLEDELTKANDTLDSKYQQMADQFAAYGSLIASMEAQFSSLKMTIAQSTSSN